MDSRRAWGILGVTTTAFFVTMMARLAVSPLIPDITATFTVTKSEVGFVLSGMGELYALLQFPSGLLTDRLGQRRVIRVSMVGIAVATAAIALSPTFLAFAASTVVLGGVCGLYFVAGTGLPIVERESTPLSESYCRKTIAAPDGTLAVSHAREDGWVDDPAYDRFGIESYLGAAVHRNDDLHGTLCFASGKARSEPLTKAEVALVDMLAEWTGYEMALRTEGRDDAGPIPAPDSGAPLVQREVDDLMTALAKRPRRVVLAGLLEGSVETQADVLAREGWEPSDVTALEHNHLPRLADMGLIEWDRETGAIDEGALFGDVEGVLRCVVDSVEGIDEVP